MDFVSDTEHSDALITKWVKSRYHGLCTCIGRSKNHMLHTKFLSDLKALQQNERINPIHTYEKVEQETG